MTSFLDIFSLVKEYCAKQISDISYGLWVEPIEPVRFEDNNKVVLFVESAFLKKVVVDNYVSLLSEAFLAVMGFEVTIEIICPDDVDNEPEIETTPTPNLSNDPVKRAELNQSYANAEYDYTFENFIVGNSNNFAYAACRKHFNKIRT